MESKLVFYIGFSVMVFIMGFVIWTAFDKKYTDFFCGGPIDIHCPFGYTCKLDDNSPAVGGYCIGAFEPIKQKIYSVFQFLKFTTKYTCPAEDWVDCMPSIGNSKSECNKEYLDWAESNCPNFTGPVY